MITGISTEALPDAVHVLVQSTGPLQYTAFKLHKPPQLVVDISEATLGEVSQPILIAGELLRQIEPVVFPEEHIVRLLLYLQPRVDHTIEVQEHQLQITLRTSESPEVAKTPSSDPRLPSSPSAAITSPQSAQPPAEPTTTANTVVTGVTFVSLPDTSVLAIQTAGTPAKVHVKQRQEPLRLSLDIEDAGLARGQEKVETVSDPGGVVVELRVYQTMEEGAPKVKVVMKLRAPSPFEIRHDENLVRLMIAKPAPLATAPAPSRQEPAALEKPPPATVPASATPGAASPPTPPAAMAQRPPLGNTESAPPPSETQAALPEAAAIGGPETGKRYTGEKISLDFQNADVNDILRLIAEVSGLNIIAGGDVHGTVTTRMVEVPWDQALDVILKINGLAQERDGNIIRVAPLERFIAERQERARAQQTEVQAEPTVTQLVPVNYAKASELRENLERLLSERGSIFINERTNTLIITDTRKNLDDMLALLETLDRQTPQVMIEARIVETSRNFLHELGVELGAQYTRITNVKFPNRIDVGGGVTPGNFLVDLPTTGAPAGAISFALAGANSLLNLRLSALERSGRGKIISNPKVATLDNKEAVIQSGERIPVQTVSAEGTQTEFVDANLSLKVTPHVTPDGYINMRISASKNEANFDRQVNGIPAITTREATTEMLVKDNDTVVIGGLYRRTINESRNSVPGISRIPVLGWLFQNNQQQDNNDELLIFITPRIIHQAEQQDRDKMPISY